MAVSPVRHRTSGGASAGASGESTNVTKSAGGSTAASSAASSASSTAASSMKVLYEKTTELSLTLWDKAEEYIRRNRNEPNSLWEGACESKSGPVDYVRIAKNGGKWLWNSPIFKLLMPFVVFSVWANVQLWLSPEVATQFARLLFVVKNIGMLVVWIRLRRAIKLAVSEGEMETVIQVEKQEWTEEESLEKVMTPLTYEEYDKEELMEFVRQNAMQISITSIMHYFWGHTTPIVLGAVLAWNSVKDMPLWKVHILKEEVTRPWKKDDFYNRWMEQMGRINNAQAQQAIAGETNVKSAKTSSKSLKQQQKQQKAMEKKAK